MAWSKSREQFLDCGLKNFATASRWYTGDIIIIIINRFVWRHKVVTSEALQVVRRRFVYDSSETMKATRSRHG